LALEEGAVGRAFGKDLVHERRTVRERVHTATYEHVALANNGREVVQQTEV
jgi:hypothetical protein